MLPPGYPPTPHQFLAPPPPGYLTTPHLPPPPPPSHPLFEDDPNQQKGWSV
jgi:hypothetical protein